MRIVIAGGHGQIALRLERLLSARGDEVAGIIRKPEQADDLRTAGAEPVVLDLESASVDEVAAVLEGADAAVFAAARARAATRPARRRWTGRRRSCSRTRRSGRAYAATWSSPRWARTRATRATRSSTRICAPRARPTEAVRARPGLDWTILRPGMLTNDAGTGLITLAASTGRGPIPRDDVAALLAELIDTPATTGLTLEAISGSVPVTVAVKGVAGN